MRRMRARGRARGAIVALLAAVFIAMGSNQFALCVAEEVPETSASAASGAIEMAASDVEGYLAAAPLRATIAAKFYAPWCAHCKRVAPAWDEFARESKRDGVVVISVDASGENARELNAKFNIKGFPTLYYFADGVAYEYQGERNVAAFRAFSKRVGPRKLAIGRKYAVDRATNRIVFEKPSKLLVLRGVFRDVTRDFARVAQAKPMVCLAIFIVGVWVGAFSVGATFFLAGDYAAARNWRDFLAANVRKAKSLERKSE